MKKKETVADKRKYMVRSAGNAKQIASDLMVEYELEKVVSFGLPEIDDRSHIWRIAVINKSDKKSIGEIVLNAKNSLVDEKRSTKKEILEKRILKRNDKKKKTIRKNRKEYRCSPLRNTIGLGDSEKLLDQLPKNSVELIFTSPPYYNARPEYTEYVDYDDYLKKMRRIIRASKRVLSDGRFFVLNVSPILLRRENRSKSSTRLAVPFDFHRIFIEEGFEFIDDIIWQKPEGAGWATGRGRRFSADRNPLQYKPVPVTEYVLVYRKKSDKLIDWFIRNHPNRKLIKESKIADGYDVTNIWKLSPSHSKDHPAIFPLKLAEKVITYYSFKNDVVLDPFGGIGTVGEAALNTKRRFVLFDNDKGYIDVVKKKLEKLMGLDANDVICINCSSIIIKNKKSL